MWLVLGRRSGVVTFRSDFVVFEFRSVFGLARAVRYDKRMNLQKMCYIVICNVGKLAN